MQVVQQANAQFKELCQTRIDARDDLRGVLFNITDLSDLFPGDPTAEAYTANRKDYINTNYKPISPGCPPVI